MARVRHQELKVQALTTVDVNKDALLHNHEYASKRVRSQYTKDIGAQ